MDDPNNTPDFDTLLAGLTGLLDGEVERRKRAEKERFVWRIFCSLLLVGVLLGGFYFHNYIAQGRQITASTNHIVAELDSALGPAGKAQSNAATTAIIAEVVAEQNCGNRAALQEVITALEKGGVLAPGSVSVACTTPPGILAPSTTTTTTTVPKENP